MKKVFLALGSNLGDRKSYLTSALEKIKQIKDVKILKQSKVYETQPWPPQPHPKKPKEEENWYLNQVIEIKTNLEPQELLKSTQKIEKELGRTKKNHWGSREIDIDILLFEHLILESEALTIPHPYITERHFVLTPLLEIAPKLKHPETQKSFQEYSAQLPNNCKVKKITE